MTGRETDLLIGHAQDWLDDPSAWNGPSRERLAHTVVELAGEVERLTRERDEAERKWLAASRSVYNGTEECYRQHERADRAEAERDAEKARADAAGAKVRNCRCQREGFDAYGRNINERLAFLADPEAHS